MKKTIIFFLLSLFLFFTIKGKNNFAAEIQNGIHKKIEHSQTEKKSSHSATLNSNPQPEENTAYYTPELDDYFQISDISEAIVYAGILSFFGLLILYFQKQKLLPYHFYEDVFSVKRFILIRSIRI